MADLRGTDLLWAMSVRQELERVTKARNDENRRSLRRTMFKVPPYIRTVKPDQYDCQLLCFGLYNRDFGKLSRMDELRLEVASEFLEQWQTPSPNPWDSLCDEVAGRPEEAEALLNLHDDDQRISSITPDIVRSVLTLDAVFLVALMSFWYFNCTSAGTRSSHGSQDKRGFRAIFDRVGVICHIALLFSDMWLFENQIPLFLILKVWNLVYGNDVNMEFNNFLKPILVSAVESFTLGYSGDHTLAQDISFKKCDHLLHCLYTFVCSSLCHDTTPPHVEDNTRRSDYSPSSRALQETARQGRQRLIRRSIPSAFQPICTSLGAMLTWTQRAIFTKAKQVVLPRTQIHNLNNLLSVTELKKAGISVKGVQTSIRGMRFQPSSYFKATLFLPRIEIDDNSERLLRNLCAYELTRERAHTFMCYLSLMNALIDTPDDVHLLRKGKEPLIALNYLGSDQDVAVLFNKLLQKLSVKFSPEVMSLIQEVHEWFSSPLRHQVTGYVSRFHERPWLFVSVIAANILFILTGLQTVYSMLSYYYP